MPYRFALASSAIRVRDAFTLIELLVVIAIISLMAGLVASLPLGDRRHAAVRSAAENLAETLRLARAKAVEQRMVCGVTFNISNGAGTSGKLLNNWDGGHWYRMVGPAVYYDDPNALASYAKPNLQDYNVSVFMLLLQEGWIGEKHVLPAKKVRFLALGDQDNGSQGWAASGRIPATYPRPWFGWWDQGTGRLYPWGGYDHALVDWAGRPCSGFYFAGSDGPISGCLNPTDRFTTNTTNTIMRIHAAGEPRALINADWLDYVIEFYPDGTAKERPPLTVRRTSWSRRGSATSTSARGGTGSGDLGAYTSHPGGGSTNSPMPITSYIEHTGVWSITLGPDSLKDDDHFGSAADAFASITPAYRVTVSPLGDIRVIRVRQTVPSGTTIDTTSITDWQNSAQVSTYYRQFIATNNLGFPRGKPIADYLTPEILAGRQWWRVVP